MIEDVNGVAFPFRIDPATGKVAWAYGSDKIRQNVRIILSTRLGERPMLRDFGTRIPSLVHDPNDDVMAELLQTQAREAVLRWEPRIMVTSVKVSQNEGEASLVLNYVHTGEPVANQMILPL
jgi:uncharacterized protein